MSEPAEDPPPAEMGPFVVLVVPDVRDVPGRQRVKRWLKCGLRDFGLRCRVIRYPTRAELLGGEPEDD